MTGRPARSRERAADVLVKGYRSGMLTLLEDFTAPTINNSKILAKCDCGKVRKIGVNSLWYGRTYSCGCTRRGRGMVPDYGVKKREPKKTFPKPKFLLVVMNTLHRQLEEAFPDSEITKEMTREVYRGITTGKIPKQERVGASYPHIIEQNKKLQDKKLIGLIGYIFKMSEIRAILIKCSKKKQHPSKSCHQAIKRPQKTASS